MWDRVIGYLVTLMLSLLAVPLAAHAQQTAKVPRVGELAERSPTDPSLAAFRQGLRELGWVEGQNCIFHESLPPSP